MEPILIELEQGGQSKDDSPHEGEEFGYVISGRINLFIGNQVIRVKKGESFYFKANSNHHVENAGQSIARVLWVSTPPSF